MSSEPVTQQHSRDAGDPLGAAGSSQAALLAAGLVVAGFLLTATFALLRPEGVVHYDDLTHYLYARWAWQWPAYLLDDWGRPGFTVLYWPAAALGWTACRLQSALIAAVTAWLAYCIARWAGIREAWAVVPLTYLQPLYTQLAQTTLTETPLALYLTLAVYLAQRGRWSASAAAISIGFVTRHEAVVFLPVWVAAAWQARVPLHRLWPIVWAPLVVNLIAPLFGMRPALARFLSPQPSSQYGAGGWLTFCSRALEAWGPAITILAVVGLRAMWSRSGGRLIVGAAAAYFLAETIIRALGLFDSGGYARFLVPICPLVAICALGGWHRLWGATGSDWRRAVVCAAAAMVVVWMAMQRQLELHEQRGEIVMEIADLYRAVLAVNTTTIVIILIAAAVLACEATRRFARWRRRLLPGAMTIIMLLAAYALAGPLHPPAEAALIRDVFDRLAAQRLADRPIVSSHVWIDYRAGRRLPYHRPSVRNQLRDAPVGTLFLWDRQFAPSQDHGLPLAEFEASTAFRRVLAGRTAPFTNKPYVIVFEKVAPWQPEA